jgi:hypothetical protein
MPGTIPNNCSFLIFISFNSSASSKVKVTDRLYAEEGMVSGNWSVLNRES